MVGVHLLDMMLLTNVDSTVRVSFVGARVGRLLVTQIDVAENFSRFFFLFCVEDIVAVVVRGVRKLLTVTVALEVDLHVLHSGYQ